MQVTKSSPYHCRIYTIKSSGKFVYSMVKCLVFIHTGKEITSMLLTQALQPLGCDSGPPRVKPPPEFDLEFNPKVYI